MIDQKKTDPGPIVLTSHPNRSGVKPTPIKWGSKTAKSRGPIIATTTTPEHRNVIGTHSGAFSVYRALAIAAGSLDPDHRADLTNTSPIADIGPFPQWFGEDKIVSLDPFGHTVAKSFSGQLSQGIDIRPTIAVTKARMNLPEIQLAMKEGKLTPDENILLEDGSINVTKAAIEPVWYLPGIARRFQCEESYLRRVLFEKTGGMFPELVTRNDLKIFLPPIGGMTAYIFGDLTTIPQADKPLTVRVHDECNGSDVFGSDICTCRPYLTHGIELCIEAAQAKGAGIIVYNRKEGRALGEVTKFLVYNARKRQEGGDSAAKYFERTECVAGVQDMRVQELMPDILLWLGVKQIDQFVSMSDMKFNALARSGIEVKKRVTIPKELSLKTLRSKFRRKSAAITVRKVLQAHASLRKQKPRL